MRRILLIATLLAASHGTALWLGSRRQHDAPLAPSQAAQAKAASSALSLSSLVEKGRALAAGEDEEEPDFAAAMDAAREKFPAGADLRAILEKGVEDPHANFSAETVAAFGAWLERDPTTALHWFSGFYREYGTSEFDEELSHHFQRSGLASLQAWIDATPQIRTCLIACAAGSFGEEDGSRVLQAAATLKSPSDRVALLAEAFRNASVAGQLASIRQLLDRSGACEFLDAIAMHKNAGLLEEVRSAGFPEAAVRRFEEEVQRKPGKRKLGRNNIDAVLNNPNRTGEEVPIQTINDWLDGPTRTNADFIGTVAGTNIVDVLPLPEPPPDLLGSLDFANEVSAQRSLMDEGRLTVADFAAWLESAAPQHPNREQEMLALVARMGFDHDPRAAFDYLQKASPEGWVEIVSTQTAWADLPPELLTEFARQIPETDPPGPVHAGLLSSYEDWYEKDPQACLDAVDAFPSGSLKDRLLEIGKEEEDAQ